jgi:crotonobetainyl-CoA:carnitine CoA-transferase CaiB-like acyl-CoA transferase
MDDADFNLRRNPPQIGEGTADILGELGYSQDDIQRLAADEVVTVFE